jgi:hypothetical protein
MHRPDLEKTVVVLQSFLQLY